jgi:hypothetical protein
MGLAFGILVEGTGQAWVDDFRFEVVGQGTPMPGSPSLLGPPYWCHPRRPVK